MKNTERNLLSMDPGKRHFAYCHVAGTQITSIGMITETIDDLKSGIFPYRLRVFYREFKKTVSRLESKHGKLTDIVIERFMARPGKGGGAVSESINVMIGVIALYCHKNNIHIELVSSALWKNRFKKRYGCDTQAQRYGYTWLSKEPLKGNPYPITDHEMDATGIALAYIETMPPPGAGTRKKTDFNYFDDFKKQIRKVWDKRAIALNYSEAKDHEREAKAKARAAGKEATKTSIPTKRSKAKTTKKK